MVESLVQCSLVWLKLMIKLGQPPGKYSYLLRERRKGDNAQINSLEEEELILIKRAATVKAVTEQDFGKLIGGSEIGIAYNIVI